MAMSVNRVCRRKSPLYYILHETTAEKAISMSSNYHIFCWLRDFIYRTGKDSEKGRLKRIQGYVLFISIPSDWWIRCVTTDLDKLNSIAC